ncbi:hypothetical protein M407DRAFT_105280 [Tulasnella calospora MUT 4182]|uniref:Zn(2)-C6 fungal-type domain-containing protein n=1 Tax=Tulasnella calospora MUT 4182 TaxID=1051891 RepID=A0A0C3QTK7_9AGAM|nr:hypothetical protein M407DRAFT_105280 [Tulasnella calospora MUT 4182]
MPPLREDDPSNIPAALRKGAACLQCRKRKMRCDAGQPHCANCVKGKKDCQYAAGRAKTKTQLLREKIQDLESKIRALETASAARHSEGNSPAGDSSSSSPHNGSSADPDDLIGSPGSEFRTILGAAASGSSSSHGVNSAAVSLSGDLDPHNSNDFYNPDYYTGSTSLWGSTGAGLDLPPSSSSASSSSVDGKWWEQPEPPREIRDYLVGVFLQRNEDFHFYIDKTRFLVSLDSQPPDCPHPSLLNAIYLLGCHFTNQPEWTVHEPMFLSRAREALLASLAHSDRLFDFLMASNLVAYYLYRTGRFLEGHHQTAGASRFAVSCGLHQIVSPVLEDNQPESSRSIRASAPWSVSDMSVRRPGSMLTPPRNGLELGQRIIVFWQTYLLDKLGSAVTSLPGSLPDEADPLTEILTAWPRTLEEYELGDVRSDETATIRNLYQPLYSATVRRRPETLQGLQCQVTALHERALRLSPSYADKSPAARTQFWQKFTTVQEAIHNFMTTLPGLQNTGLYGEIPPSSPMAPINSVIFVTHTLAQLSIIQLHNSLATDLPTSYETCLTAAREILRLTQLLTSADFARTTMEVVLSYAWTICAQVLIRHHRTMLRRFEDVSRVDTELDCIVAALENLRGTYPVVDFQLRKVADWRRS